MNMRGRSTVAVTMAALTVTVCVILGSAASVAAATRGPRIVGSGPQASVPIDESKLSFRAFRSFDLPIVPGKSFFLEVMRWTPAGPIHFAEVVDGSEVFLADATWEYAGSVNGEDREIAQLKIDSAVEGTHNYRGVIAPTDTLDGLTLNLEVVVALATIDIAVTTSPNPVQTHHPVLLSANLTGGGTGEPLSGQFEWRNGDTGALIATRDQNDISLTYPTLPVGTYHYTLTYTGDSTRAASTSPVYVLTVIPDAVDASNVGTQFPRFYPVTDGYRDTVAIKGTRLESLAVAIHLFDSNGVQVRSFSVPMGTGTYSQAWNGRNSAGTLLPAGMYMVVQTLTDSYGVKKNVITNLALSHAKLVQYTKDVTLDGSAISASGHGAGGSVTVSTAGGYVKLSAGSSWAIAGWEFYVPAATVYKSVSVLVYAKAGRSVPPTYLGMQDFVACPRVSGGDWSESCFANWTGVGNTTNSTAWYATPATSSSAYRSGRYVRGMVTVRYGTVYVYEARVRVVYQVLEPGWGGVTVRR
jgi:hypothetical protein